MNIYADYFRAQPNDAANDQSHSKQITREQIAQHTKDYLAAGEKIHDVNHIKPREHQTATEKQIAYHSKKDTK